MAIMEEYLTVRELSERIKFSKRTLYNLIYEGILVRGKHYIKPRPKKILFKWSAIQAWIEQPLGSEDEAPCEPRLGDTPAASSEMLCSNQPKSSINI
ncbi:MAG: helix-turn-helix domain-containing protein [Thermodesulfobacteriota bacterium]|nr:helix-turn-helix domain-containing protein [Thermodesulfobacteriota bacterium]